MDFDDTPKEAAVREAARTWLEQNAPRRDAGTLATRRKWRDASPEAQLEHVRACKEWQRKLFDGGWAGITWPTEYGGRGGTAIEQAIFNQEMARFEVGAGALAVGVGMVGPTLIEWGTDEQKSGHLQAILSGDEVWCQLFSEPGAGSDLAGLRTTAELDGDDLGRQRAEGLDLARPPQRLGDPAGPHRSRRPEAQGHHLLPRRHDAVPGIDIRPLRQIDGVAHFNEVFLTDVRIPASQVVGPVDGGWRVTHSTLQSERALIGGGEGVRFEDLAGPGTVHRAVGRSGPPAGAGQGLYPIRTAALPGTSGPDVPQPRSRTRIRELGHEAQLLPAHRRAHGPRPLARGCGGDARDRRQRPTAGTGSSSSSPSGPSASVVALIRCSGTSSGSASSGCHGSLILPERSRSVGAEALNWRTEPTGPTLAVVPANPGHSQSKTS